jgi:glycosyltransferase involved in cell wall biosynthesis
LTAVLHLISSLRVGGTEAQAVQLACLLREHGRYDVTLACLDGDGPLRDAPGLGTLPILEYPLTSLHDGNTVAQLRRLRSDLRALDVDVVHTHDVYSNIFGLPAARAAGVRARIGSRRDTGGVSTTAKRRVEATAFRMAHRVVANCDAVKRDLMAQKVHESKIVTIPNAVDVQRLNPRLERAQAFELFGLPDNRRFVVLVANLRHDVKDHPTFLRAAQRIKAAVPASAFVVAGTGPLTAPMTGLSERLGVDDVFFIGACSAIGDLLALAEVCVLSSRAEGLPNAVLEYMAAARPVVATAVGGVGEAVVDGETGYLVAAGDDRALADRVISLLDDPDRARVMGEEGRRRTEDQFSGHLLVERTVRLYESLLDGRQR